MKRIIILYIFLTVCFAAVFAQQNEKGKITGRVLDEISKKGVEYATISVYQPGNTKPVNGATSNDKGVFTIAGLAAGRYSAVIDFIGHQSKMIDSVVIGNKGLTVNIGDVVLAKKDQV